MAAAMVILGRIGQDGAEHRNQNWNLTLEGSLI
jgi:hypothetical protein